MFSGKQIGVALGMGAALAITIASFLAAPYLPPVPDALQARITLWCEASLIAAFWVFVCVARIARHRFFNAADIDGGGLGAGTARVQLLNAMLQNTLEQAVLACVAYGALLLAGPAAWGALAALFALYFSIGRLAFIALYAHGAGARAFGFALTFYPTAGLIFASVPHAVSDIWRVLVPG